MYILEGKVYHHMVKCGGQSFMGNVLTQKKDKVLFAKAHFPFKLLPREYENFEHIGVVRNPIDWYKSVYSYHFHLKEEGQTFNYIVTMLIGDDKGGFERFVERATDLDKFLRENKIIEKRVRDFLVSSPRNIYSYFTMFFTNYNELGLTGSLYNWFMNHHNMYQIKTYKLGDIEVYKEFGLTPDVVLNQTKDRIKDSIVVTEEIKMKIRKADKRAFDYFKF